MYHRHSFSMDTDCSRFPQPISIVFHRRNSKPEMMLWSDPINANVVSHGLQLFEANAVTFRRFPRWRQNTGSSLRSAIFTPDSSFYDCLRQSNITPIQFPPFSNMAATTGNSFRSAIFALTFLRFSESPIPSTIL